MKKHIAFCMLATLLTFSLLTGCAQKPTGDGTDEQASTKPVISFEGVVADVTDGVVTLENGQKIQITEDTAFGGDPDTQNEVSSDIQPGNYIQGYTTDDADAEQVTAGNIWKNEAATDDEETLYMLDVNFEGRVAAVKDGLVVLEDGKEIRITADTAFGDPHTQNEVSSDIQPGNYIQGYSSDALDDAQRTASHIWTNTPAE